MIVPFLCFSGSVFIVMVAFGPSPSRVTPARVMLYFALGVRFSNRYLINEAEMLWHADETRRGKNKNFPLSSTPLAFILLVLFCCCCRWRFLRYVCSNIKHLQNEIDVLFSLLSYKMAGFANI